MRRDRLTALALTGGALAALAGGCQSNQEKSARLSNQGSQAFKQQGLKVGKPNRDVRVVDSTVLHDANGAAVVLDLKSSARTAQVQVPVGIDVLDAKKKSVFKNDGAGLEPTLVSVPTLPPGAGFWVNDQVVAADTPRSVRAVIGAPRTPTPPTLPKLVVSQPKLEVDPTSGLEAKGFVKNASKVDQGRFTVFAVARKGSKVVAAGRGGIQKLKAGRRARYSIFFIGNPKGARLEVSAPPTTLK